MKKYYNAYIEIKEKKKTIYIWLLSFTFEHFEPIAFYAENDKNVHNFL